MGGRGIRHHVPFAANISNCLAYEVAFTAGTSENESLHIAAAMGHTVEVHHRSYRTSEWRSVRKAFAEAS